MLKLLYVNSSTPDNINLFEQLRFYFAFKNNNYWNNYLPKKVNQTQNPCFEHLIDPSFQGTNLNII